MNDIGFIRVLNKDFLISHYNQYTGSFFLWQNRNVYVMDNHLSAAWCWLQQCKKDEKYNFMHIDQHYDMAASFFNSDLDEIRDNPNLSYEDFTLLKKEHADSNLFTWDDYIMAIYLLYPEWFVTNIMVTRKIGNVDNKWGHEAFAFKEEKPIKIHNVINKYITQDNYKCEDLEHKSLPWIVNLDLDVFFDFNPPYKQVISDEEIVKLAKSINDYIDKIQVLTIALSPTCLFEAYNSKVQWKTAFEKLKLMSNALKPLMCFPFPEFDFL